MQSRASVLPLLTILTLQLPMTRASAGGLEYAGQGARGLGRAGAVTAKAEDPMVLAYNPAGLAELRGSQLLVDLNLALFDACVDPAGYYGWGIYGGGVTRTVLPDPVTGEDVPVPLGEIDPDTNEVVAADYYADPYDTVCLDQAITPIPQLVWSLRVSEKLGLGFGFVFPAVQPGGAWGDRRTGVIRNAEGELRPAATRYMGIASSSLGAFPNLGLGYRINEQLRLGAAFEWGVVAVSQTTIAPALGGTAPTTDMLAHLKAQDWFVPALTASVHVVPVASVDLVGVFRWQADIDAAGDVDITTGVFDSRFVRTDNGHLLVPSVQQHMPWKLRLGARYADRIMPRPRGTGSDEGQLGGREVVHDPLQDERWDVELDLQYEANSVNDRQRVTLYRCSVSPTDPTAADVCPARGEILFVPESGATGQPLPFPHPLGPQGIEVEHHWKDQLSVRLGGTLNVVPGRLGVSAGTHYETRGVDPDYMQIDFWPVSRVGLHGGVIVRLFRKVDVVFSYAHIFQETIVVAAPAHQDRAEIHACYAPATGPNVVVPERCHAPAGQIRTVDKSVGPPRFGTDERGNPITLLPEVLEERSQGAADGTAKLAQSLTQIAYPNAPWIVNAGRYRSSFDIVAVGMNVHF